MTLQEFAQLLERIDAGESPEIPYNLHSGIRELSLTSPDVTSESKNGWGHLAWARFFREVIAAEYPAVSREGDA